MAQRRCLHNLTRHGSNLLTSKPSSFQSSLKTLTLPHHLRQLHNLAISSTPLRRALHHLRPNSRSHCCSITRHFSSKRHGGDESTDEEDFDEEVGEGSDGDEDDDEDDVDDDDDDENVSNCQVKRVYTAEEKANEAAEIGYKVVGPLQRSDRVFKEYEPAFAVVQIGSHQFKVSNGDCIYTERLKFCEVNDKLILNKVLLLGTSTQTVVGRPTLPDAAVHAVVEEHALDAKVIIFKKKRRKNYRRTKGHRQELTKLRITSVEGIEIPQKTESVKPEKTTSGKSEKTTSGKSEKAAAKKSEKVAVTA